jgi:hypothetical protein
MVVRLLLLFLENGHLFCIWVVKSEFSLGSAVQLTLLSFYQQGHFTLTKTQPSDSNERLVLDRRKVLTLTERASLFIQSAHIEMPNTFIETEERPLPSSFWETHGRKERTWHEHTLGKDANNTRSKG